MKTFFKEFKEFISKGNLVEVAVAFVLGLAFKAVIDAFMTGIVNPIIGLILGKQPADRRQAILDAEYDAMEAALDAEQKAAATEP